MAEDCLITTAEGIHVADDKTDGEGKAKGFVERKGKADGWAIWLGFLASVLCNQINKLRHHQQSNPSSVRQMCGFDVPLMSKGKLGTGSEAVWIRE
jgi:hypothetical protein